MNIKPILCFLDVNNQGDAVFINNQLQVCVMFKCGCKIMQFLNEESNLIPCTKHKNCFSEF